MADEIKMENVGTRLIMRENFDRNGPALHIAMTDKNAFRQAVNSVNQPGDVALVDGGFTRIEDFTADPIALFTNEADADAFLATKGPGFKKNARADTIDNFNFVIEVEN